MTKELRDKLKITQKQLSERLGVDKGTVYRWEARKQNPSNKNLQKIVDLEDMITYYEEQDYESQELAESSDRIIDKHNKIMDIFTNIYKFLRGF